MKSTNTSWGKVASWYDALLEDAEKNYQKDVILPNLLRCVQIKKGERLLDVACGQGFFSREFAKLGATVVASDISPELVAFAKKASTSSSIEYHVASAHELDFLSPSSIQHALTILALQNIANPPQVFKAVRRTLIIGSRYHLVLNHPAFRIPRASGWGWDEEQKVQYRREDRYLSESKEKIQMHPGKDPSAVTISYHRPLQYFVKALARSGFVVSNMEEWVSNRESDSGPRAKAENRARAEFPLFLYLEATAV
jgi:SAM-dependent methyltransferase